MVNSMAHPTNKLVSMMSNRMRTMWLRGFIKYLAEKKEQKEPSRIPFHVAVLFAVLSNKPESTVLQRSVIWCDNSYRHQALCQFFLDNQKSVTEIEELINQFKSAAPMPVPKVDYYELFTEQELELLQ